ncbi:MAG TPA: mechanosensitive ion channel family protein [Vicinamibacterales bacterium]|nr:mechanosensitive ion channel family protein [Vicinamibacterales bacterium]
MVAALLMCTFVEAQQPPTPPPLQSAQIVDHLEHTIAWFRRVQTLEQQADLSDDAVSRQRLHQSSLAALQLAFDFAHATVAIVKPEPTAPAPAPGGPGTERGFDQAATRLAERVATLQSRLDAVTAALTHAPARSRAALAGQRDELTAALALAKDVQSTVQNLAQFAATSTAASDAANSLVGQINELERTVPEARHTQSTKSTTATTAQSKTITGGTATTSFRPDSAGLVALATDLVALGGQRRQLTEALRDTDALAKGVDDLRAPLTALARDFARRTDVAAAPPANAAEAARTRLDLQNAAAQFKTLSTALVPLGEQGIAVETTRGTLGEWRDDLSERVGAAARQLLLRSLLLIVAIGALLIVSEIWRRATFRYLHDFRRRRQFLVLRRVVVAIAITLILVAGFVSEIGSLATYAGFVTAGVAVAMQNVILAVVAYFFLIGRYGVRVGDRITLAGVTGNVIEIGLVRIYLMELAGTDLHPTGRVVVLSNAVMFQPAALFKQVPGADYFWHVVTITLSPATDLATAESRLEAAAESVYEGYRASIERQHAALQRFMDVETAVPRTDVRSRVTAAGLECTVRYPVDASHAGEIDRAMMTAIRQTIASEPPLTLISSFGPTPQQAA